MRRGLTNKLVDYPNLLRQVKVTLIEGQQRIEQERVATYWETGRLIHTHILQHKDRGEYGGKVLKHLAGDLNVHVRLLQQCVQFARTYPKVPKVNGRSLFNWSHYRKLITISNDKKRLQLENRAAQKGWTAEELAFQVREDRPLQIEVLPSPKQKLREPLTPLRGELNTYQIVERPTVGGEPERLVDLGFGIFRKLPSRSHLSKGDFVGENYKKKNATAKDLYTYRAVVEKVVDGDTLKVRIDLGYDDSCRQVLRLRGIDCPELDTKEGQSAKTFVQSYIKAAQMIIMHSSRSDKYDRYLADVFIPREEKEEVFLNNLLLEKNFAVRWEY